MNRPLALIQGDLALPNARLLRGLPPPYGVYRWPARAETQRRAQPTASTGAQQAIQDAVRRWTPLARHSPSAPGQKFRFLYKLPRPRDHSSRLDAELAEARHYLEMGKTRQRSFRSDYRLGVTIFVACCIVLAWLLTTCSTQDDQRAMAAITRSAVAQQGAPEVVHPQAQVGPAPLPAGVTPTFAQTVPAPAQPVSKAALRSEPKPSLQAALQGKAKARRNMAAPRQNEVQADERLALYRSIRPATGPTASAQAVWTAHPSTADDETGQSAWLAWATQQRRETVTTRTSTSTSVPTPPDADWNAHMTQRRITDNPSAFQAASGQN
jgi:hypothetical protein